MYAVREITVFRVGTAIWGRQGGKRREGAFSVRPEQGWGWLLVGGVISLLLGIMIWRQFPLSGAWAVGVLVGIRLIFAGWTMIMLGATGHAAAKAASA